MKKLNRRKDESKAARSTVQSVVLSGAHLPKEEPAGVKVKKTRLFRADFVGVTLAETKPFAPKQLKTGRTQNESGRKKVRNNIENAGQHLVNCGECGELFTCNNRTSCTVDAAKEEFMVLCAHCKKELVLFNAVRRQIDKVLRQMDEAS